MERSGLLEMFDVMIDGIRSEELKIKGKPEPDIFSFRLPQNLMLI
jgi:hypothetical protein